MRIEVKNDLYDISWRVKEINSGYKIVWDTDKQKYLVMHSGKVQLTLPFKVLDKRTIDYIIMTRVDNLEKLCKNIDKDNQKKREHALKEGYDKFENRMSKRLREAERGGM